MEARRFATLQRWALPLVPALAISLYWILSWQQGESLSVAAIYRHGDYTYFPGIAGLAHFSVGEWLVAEQLGEGVRSLPFPGLLLHGLAFGVLGPLGLALADALLAVGAYYASRRLLRTCGVGYPTDEMLALVLSCGLLSWPENLFSGWTDWTFRFHLWGFRIPRPLVTDLLLLLCVERALRVFVRERDDAREWAWLGFWYGLLLQSNFYAAATVGLGVAVGLADRVRRGWSLGRAARSTGSLALATAATAWPFALQRLLEHPDVPVRLGSFPVPRLEPLGLGPALLKDIAGEVAQAVAVAALGAAVVAWRRTGERRLTSASLLALSLLCALSALALPASTLLLARTVQPYHFVEELVTFKTLVFLVATGCVLEAVLAVRFLRDGLSPVNRARRATALLAVCALLAIAGALELHRPWLRRTDHVRSDFEVYRFPGYRAAFRELTETLEAQRDRGARVVGTLDIQVHAWWSLFGGGQLFSPDPFATGVSDSEIEERLLRLLRTLGATTEALGRLLHVRPLQIFFLSCDKYQFSRGYQAAPLSDYPPEVRRHLAQTSELSSWVIAMPLSERRRVLERYNRSEAVGEDLRLDLIVLGRGPLDRDLVPPAARFGLVFQNDWFRVYAAPANRG